ncbi:MAG: cupin domain-containing protein [Pseudomonadota bacterium]|nr:cupin domain-containing protein [Pseudomonadota bacterium]
MKPMILPILPDTEYYFEEGCYIIEQLNTDADPALSIARARVSPGRRTRWHSLTNTVERYQVLCGTGLVEVGDLPPTPVQAGDIVVIPAGVRQRILNNGEVDLIFLALCTPRFQPENYQDLED